MTPSIAVPKPESLAVSFQEVFLAIERLRANPKSVTDAEAFRQYIRDALVTAVSRGLAAGFCDDDVRYAAFATVAFLDESVLNSEQPVFIPWKGEPLQKELFETQIAGAIFFQYLVQLLGRDDSPDLADVLEVYYLCMLLGFRGCFAPGGAGTIPGGVMDQNSASNGGGLEELKKKTREKIQRIRGPLSLCWTPLAEAPRISADPWVRKLGIVAIVCTSGMIVLFVAYKVLLSNGVHIV
jgi:type VI secretion system protein ImpK